MRRPRALDLFCGAGGVSMGLWQAGFQVTGVDLAFQPHYPAFHMAEYAPDFEFVQGDALEFDLSGYDLIAASPPCQFASELTPAAHRANHANLIPVTRERLRASGAPYMIENVAGARAHLHNPVMLCGSMFGLGVWRHRYFECSFPTTLTPPCNHSGVPVLISGVTRRNNIRREHGTQACRDASGIDWMTRSELDQAIPPAYSRWLGEQALTRLEVAA